MRRPSPWLIAVVILLGILIMRESRLRRVDDSFLGWFLQNAAISLPPAPITLVEIGRADFQSLTPAGERKPLPKGEAARRSLSPLEYALFLQAILEFHPAVVGIEPFLIWRTRDKVQEQVFLDQAMRVPKLLVSLELGGKGARDLAPEDLPVLPNVSGTRGALPEFSGINRQPDDDIRLISTPGLVSPPNENRDRLRVPMLFEYRGEIVPSFALEAIILWLRATPGDVQVELGSQIVLPNGWKIPLHPDGSTTINLAARQSVRRLSLSELLVAAQEHDHRLSNIENQIVLLRLEGDPLQGPNLFAAAIATIQTNSYIRPAGVLLSWLITLVFALLAASYRMISRSNFFLGAIACSAGYAMVELAFLSNERLWLPMFLPLALLWFIVIVRLVDRDGIARHEIVATA